MRQWFTMQAATETAAAEIVIYDEIGKSFWGEPTVDAKSFLDGLKALGDVDKITLRVNSPGGDVFDGVAIHNALKSHKAKVTAFVDGIAASIASYIVMAADKIVMPANAFMLIHNASGFSFGNADDMRAIADDLDRIDKTILATYEKRSKSTGKALKAIMKEDRLMDAAEAKELGLADEVTKEVKMAAKFSLRLLPQAAADKFRAVAETKSESEPVQRVPPHLAADAGTEPAVNASLEPPAPVVAAVAEPAAGATAQVVDLKKEGVEEHKTYVGAVTDLCTLAGALDRVGQYVRNATPIDDVRKDLLARRAEQDVRPQHATPSAQRTATVVDWKTVTDKINARK